MEKEKERTSDKDEIPVAEWVVAALGAAFLFTTLSFLVYRGILERTPPRFEAEILKIERIGASYAVAVRIHNRGGRPVSKLVVRGSRGAESEREVTIDYLPSQSSREVSFQFDEWIDSDQFTSSFTSYNVP